MSDETPSTEHVREAWAEMSGWDMSLDESDAAFDRWLESVRADHEKAVRERIAQDMAAEQRRARAAHQSAQTDHFAHDYCRWVGHAEAFGTAARIAREGA